MKKVFIINGPNMNMLGIREPELYGSESYDAMVDLCKRTAEENGFECECYQSNHEGSIVDFIQNAAFEARKSKKSDFYCIVINAAAYSHTSVAILDALKAAALPAAEVHITEPLLREEFRRTDYPSLYAEKIIAGMGIKGYKEAIEYMAQKS